MPNACKAFALPNELHPLERAVHFCYILYKNIFLFWLRPEKGSGKEFQALSMTTQPFVPPPETMVLVVEYLDPGGKYRLAMTSKVRMLCLICSGAILYSSTKDLQGASDGSIQVMAEIS